MRPSLSTLLPALALGGCVDLPFGGRTSCDDFDGGTFDNERSYGVTETELQEALDADGELSEEACHELCRLNHRVEDLIVEIHSCSVRNVADGTTLAVDTGVDGSADTGMAPPYEVTCSWTEQAVCEGRAHAALTSHAEGSGPTHLAAWLARATHAEAASVKAFVALAKELHAQGAPTALVADCHRAATDEIDHARRMGALAHAFGGRPTKPRMGPTPQRSLLDLAIENAVEGCVRETWSAMVAHWQALHAAEPELRRVMARIAVDEARHGELAHRIHDWAMARLSPAEQQEVRDARARAIEQLVEGLEAGEHPELVDAAGLPGRAAALHLARQLIGELWERRGT